MEIFQTALADYSEHKVGDRTAAVKFKYRDLEEIRKHATTPLKSEGAPENGGDIYLLDRDATELVDMECVSVQSVWIGEFAGQKKITIINRIYKGSDGEFYETMIPEDSPTDYRAYPITFLKLSANPEERISLYEAGWVFKRMMAILKDKNDVDVILTGAKGYAFLLEIADKLEELGYTLELFSDLDDLWKLYKGTGEFDIERAEIVRLARKAVV